MSEIIANNLLDQDLLNNNIYFGNEIDRTLNDYIVKNYKFQKIIFFCKKSDYKIIQDKFHCEDFELIIIVLSEFDVSALDEITSGIKCDIRMLVAFGDFDIVQAVKYFAIKTSVSYAIIKVNLPIIEELLNWCLIFDKTFVPMQCESPVQILLDSIEIAKASRKEISCCAYSMINKISYFEDYYLNYIVYKNQFFYKYFIMFKDVYVQVYNLMDKLAMLDQETVLRLGDMVLYLSALLKRINYDIRSDKLYVFSNLYLLFADKGFDEYGLCNSGVIGLQTFNAIYRRFICNVHKMSFNYINIEKRVNLFDKHFMKYRLDYNAFEYPDVGKLRFVLSKNKYLLIDKIITISDISKKFLNKSFCIQEDYGYHISKNINSIAVIKSICFSGDIIFGNNFLKIIRDYGALDMFEKNV